MTKHSLALRAGAWVLAAVLMATYGCARPLPPPASYVDESGDLARGRFPSTPRIATDDQPLRFVGLTPEERNEFAKWSESFDADRERRVERRKTAQLGTRNTAGNMTADCVIQTFIIFSPICIIIVPFALVMAHSVEGRRASSKEPYLPSLPSERELARVDVKVREHLTAAGIAKHVSRGLPADGLTPNEDRFPRLLIRAESAKFTPGRMIVISIVAQAQLADGVGSSPTEHRYYLGYAGDGDDLVRQLGEAQASLAKSILYIYGFGPSPSYVPHRGL